MKVREVRGLATTLEKPRKPKTLRQARQLFERLYVDATMRAYVGDREKVAEVLGISLSSLKTKLRKGFGGRR